MIHIMILAFSDGLKQSLIITIPTYGTGHDGAPQREVMRANVMALMGALASKIDDLTFVVATL